MLVKDKIMYHHHRPGFYDSIWTPGSKIMVDDNFNSQLCSILKWFRTGVKMSDKSLKPFDRILAYYLKEENIKKIDEKKLIKLLSESKRIISDMNIYNRELILEEERKQNFSSLPSRLHSIWVCEEEQIEFWEKCLNGNTTLFRVELNGDLFHSSDLFLPDEGLPANEIKEAAKKYWDPVFKTEEEIKKSEYLFQGEVKVLEKVKKAH